LLDLGDTAGVEGYLFRTCGRGALASTSKIEFSPNVSLDAREVAWTEDVETCYRQRYLDLIANPEAPVFAKPAREDHLVASAATEITRVPRSRNAYASASSGGAAARPLLRHHNTPTSTCTRARSELYLVPPGVGAWSAFTRSIATS